MRIACLGGGPAGLYLAISMKLRDPGHEIDLFERNRADDTFGWGVVFSDQTVENLIANDRISGEAIAAEFAHWDDIDVHIHGQRVRSGGHGFIGIGRKRLLEILQHRARELGVNLAFEHEASSDLADWRGYDLVIAADGANSAIRNAHADLRVAELELALDRLDHQADQDAVDERQHVQQHEHRDHVEAVPLAGVAACLAVHVGR